MRQEARTSAPQVSVVVPTHNRSTLLLNSVAAHLGQVGADLEVVVVDDTSEVPAAEVLSVVTDPRLKVIRNRVAGGVSLARNIGIEAATGTWISFCDDDDLPAPTKVAAQLQALGDQPDADWSFVDAVRVNDRLEIIGDWGTVSSDGLRRMVVSRNVVPGGGSGVLARTATVRAVGSFDPAFSMHADYDLWLRLAAVSDVVAVRRPLLAYRVHGGAMSQRDRRTDSEWQALNDKHRDLRAAAGVVADKSYYRMWYAERQHRANRRVMAATSYLRSAPAIGLGRAVARAAEAVAVGGAMARRDARRRRLLERTDPAWFAEVESWLGPLRAGLPLPTCNPA